MEFVPTVELGFFPLDDELELLPGSLTPSLQEALVRLGAWIPFAAAGRLLVDFMGLGALSEATVRRHTEAAGAAYVDLQEEGVANLEQSSQPESPGPDKLVLEVDGAMVPLVGGEWGEVKTLVIGEAGEPVTVQGESQVNLEEISSFSRLSDCESFARLSLVETQRRQVATAGEVGVVADGAEWIQGFVDYHRPDAVRILDFPHAAEYVGEIGQKVFGEGSETTKAWLQDRLHRLKHEGGSGVLGELRSLIQIQDEAADLKGPLAYLEKREAQMQYPSFRSQGWPIGSGAVESANKLVVEARLKGAGMHWSRKQVNPMLALRNIVCSDRWAEGWPQIAGQVRQQAVHQRRVRGRRSERTLPAEPQRVEASEIWIFQGPEALKPLVEKQPHEVTMVLPETKAPRRPAPDHPWRRAPVGRIRL